MGVDAPVCEQHQHARCVGAQRLEQLPRLGHGEGDVGAAGDAVLRGRGRRERGGSGGQVGGAAQSMRGYMMS